MALTSDDLAALDAAIASATLEVEYKDRRVRYRSMSELMDARAHVASVLAAQSATGPGLRIAKFTFTTARGD